MITAGVLGACSQAKETFGLNRSSPDEFAVVTRAPLKLPPDYSLRPPTPGTPRPQEGTTHQAARAILVGEAERAARDNGITARTPGETALLSQAGATDADPGIREKVDSEAAVRAEDDGGLVRRLLFWREREPPGQIVDASRESKRIQENIALGENVSKGAVPVIQRRERGWLEGIF